MYSYSIFKTFLFVNSFNCMQHWQDKIKIIQLTELTESRHGMCMFPLYSFL